jgi:hypothetical protein
VSIQTNFEFLFNPLAINKELAPMYEPISTASDFLGNDLPNYKSFSNS